ncbi:hypothetical protein RRG08_065471 [Elysia crispata]|uniref:Uncharacterized protein n=1 Tax=Elysia crispata TaxID=231223 RepID=A0AAE1AQ79_9GAST|nr:hypothetical protein RRG08_065471 [Elysia crispata]
MVLLNYSETIQLNIGAVSDSLVASPVFYPLIYLAMKSASAGRHLTSSSRWYYFSKSFISSARRIMKHPTRDGKHLAVALGKWSGVPLFI